MKHNSLLVYPKEAQEILGVGPTKFYELIKLPHFPKTRSLTEGKRAVYLRTELEAWVRSLPATVEPPEDILCDAK